MLSPIVCLLALLIANFVTSISLSDLFRHPHATKKTKEASWRTNRPRATYSTGESSSTSVGAARRGLAQRSARTRTRSYYIGKCERIPCAAASANARSSSWNISWQHSSIGGCNSGRNLISRLLFSFLFFFFLLFFLFPLILSFCFYLFVSLSFSWFIIVLEIRQATPKEKVKTMEWCSAAIHHYHTWWGCQIWLGVYHCILFYFSPVPFMFYSSFFDFARVFAWGASSANVLAKSYT